MGKRIAWMDTARFLGIFMVYLYHMGEHAGHIYGLVFASVVQLFFLVSGFSEDISEPGSWKECIGKSVKRILIPYFVFGILSVAVNCIEKNSYTVLLPGAISVAKGSIRNTFYAPALWFLTCLFAVRIMFYGIRRICRGKALSFAVCLVIYALTSVYLRPVAYAKWVYNIDSALYYMVFYAAGYAMFGWLRDLYQLDTARKKAIFAGVGAVCAAYTGAFFFGKDLLAVFGTSMPAKLVIGFVQPMLIAICMTMLALLLENIALLGEIGRNTLYLCGSEFIIKEIAFLLIALLGLELNLVNSFSTYLYVFILLAAGSRLIVPAEKEILKKIGI